MCISVDRAMHLFYKELMHVAYLFILTTESDARSMIINSGALEFWLNFDLAMKLIFTQVFPPNMRKMLGYMEA